ncbi:ivns1abpa, partial [Symbiodinium sp. KB8]
MALPMKTTMKKAAAGIAMKGSAMKAKSMKAKAMKAMKKKAISKIAQGKRAKLAVFKGSKEKTYTGLHKTDLMKNKSGRIVTKKQHAKGKALFQQFAKKWLDAVMTARQRRFTQREGKKKRAGGRLRPVLPLISKEAPSIYVCGGSCGTAMDSAERFNPRTNQWEMLPSMCMPRRACAAASAGGKFYVLGGVDVPRFGGSEETQQEWMFQDKYCPECFDPVLNQWELLPPMNRPYTHAAATALGGFIYVFGGLSFGHVLDQ